jgi:hypothetical protein
MLSVDLNAPALGTLATLVAIVVSVGGIFLARALQKRDDAMKGLDAEDEKTVKNFLRHCANLRSALADLKLAIENYDKADSAVSDPDMPDVDNMRSYVDTMNKSLDTIAKLLFEELDPAFTEVGMVRSAEIRTNANNLYAILHDAIEGDSFNIEKLNPQVAEQTIENIDGATYAFWSALEETPNGGTSSKRRTTFRLRPDRCKRCNGDQIAFPRTSVGPLAF